MIGIARPKFLLLTPICVLLALAAASLGESELALGNLWLIMAGAVAAHVAVNALNEVADFRSGLDFKTSKTPFSGGSGTLVQYPELTRAASILGVLATLVVVVSGGLLLKSTGLTLLPYGLIGIAIVLLYSGPISRQRWLVLIAPGLGFGPMMVGGSAAALGGELSAAVATAALVVFFQVNNLLLLNQFPDRDPDREVGRDNWVIANPHFAAQLYAVFSIAGFIVIAVAVWMAMLPASALLAMLVLPVALKVSRTTSISHATGLPESALAGNVMITLATPALLAIGIGLSHWM